MGAKKECGVKGEGGKKEVGGAVSVFKMDWHCEGCATKVKDTFKHMKAVVKADRDGNIQTVTVNLDPTQIKARLEEITNNKVEIISPPPKKNAEEKKTPEGVIAVLKDKSVDELRKLLPDKDAYHQFLMSLDQVKIQNNTRDELQLRKEILQLARDNLEKEAQIMELRNQCRIIRTSELAAAQEKLSELERQKEEMLRSCSPAALLYRLQDSMNKTEEESETLHRQLLDREMDLGTFVQKYKKVRTTYQRRALIHLAAKTSPLV